MEKLLSGLIDFELQPAGATTLMRQLYDGLRAAILDGSLPPNFRLPSSRDLARQLKISRNTVSFVVDQLAMEGYLDVARGRRPSVAAASKTGLPASVSAARTACTPMWVLVTPSNRPNGWIPMPAISTRVAISVRSRTPT